MQHVVQRQQLTVHGMKGHSVIILVNVEAILCFSLSEVHLQTTYDICFWFDSVMNGRQIESNG
jgi:hypothetical protein